MKPELRCIIVVAALTLLVGACTALPTAATAASEPLDTHLPDEIEGMVQTDRPLRVSHGIETTGTHGAPDATTTIDGRQLPPPEKTFGGVIPTPALDRIAENGLRYTNFHSTAVCSLTRAALITGRNHHQMGYGTISETATGYPGYNSIMTKDKATIGKILKGNGYATSWSGKNHNTPSFQSSSIGPFDQWPTGLGFEYFYGFMGGDTNQWQPANLAPNTTYIRPYEDNPDFNLNTALADEAIDHIKRLHALDPDQQFFVYYVPGADLGAVALIATHNPVDLIVSTGMKIYGEESGRSTVKGRAEQTAKEIADVLKKRFQEQGWID